MTTDIIKKKSRLLIKKTIVANSHSIMTPEIFKNINSQIIKDRKKLVPDKKKRIAVIRLARSKSLSFDDALQLINKAEKGFVVQKAQEKLNTKERRKLAKESLKLALSFAKEYLSTNQTRKKLWVSMVSGGGGPGTGKRR